MIMMMNAQKAQGTQAIGVWTISNTISIELLDIEYGIDDIAIVREPDGTISDHVIHYDAGIEDEGTAYIQPHVGGWRLYFDECLRV